MARRRGGRIMKLFAVLGITLIITLMTLYEWSRMDPQKQKKEKAAFVTFTTVGWLLAILLVYYPELPGPTQVMEAIYKPFGKVLE
jgi:4-hydroxybenzoate polyprenyltransferase